MSYVHFKKIKPSPVSFPFCTQIFPPSSIIHFPLRQNFISLLANISFPPLIFSASPLSSQPHKHINIITHTNLNTRINIQTQIETLVLHLTIIKHAPIARSNNSRPSSYNHPFIAWEPVPRFQFIDLAWNPMKFVHTKPPSTWSNPFFDSISKFQFLIFSLRFLVSNF